MKHIFLVLCLIASPAYAGDAAIKVAKVNNKPVSNLRLDVTDNFRFDSNTIIDDKSLFKGKYDSDAGVVYKFTSTDSIRVSATEKNNTMSINFRHKF